MASSATPARIKEGVERENLLTAFRNQLFGGSWGKLEFELKRLLQIAGDGSDARHERILEDLKTLEALRRRQAEDFRSSERGGSRRPVLI